PPPPAPAPPGRAYPRGRGSGPPRRRAAGAFIVRGGDSVAIGDALERLHSQFGRIEEREPRLLVRRIDPERKPDAPGLVRAEPFDAPVSDDVFPARRIDNTGKRGANPHKKRI
ncbi:MAG: hypothetical protein AAFQ96_09325, partial [Pseudomonadota bacterium]